MFKLSLQELLLAAFSVVALAVLFKDVPSGGGEDWPTPGSSENIVVTD